jgi:uncharacterized protein with PQ loop repeat
MTLLAQTLGWIGGALGTLMCWPQAWRLLVRHQTAGLSQSACMLGVLTGWSWLVYGIQEQRAVQIGTNAAALVAHSAVLLGLVLLRRPPTRSWLSPAAAGLALTLAVAGLGVPAVTGALAVTFTIASAMPQIDRLRQDRRLGRLDVRGVSQGRWLLSAVCNLCWTGYAALMADAAILTCATLMTLLSLTVLKLSSEAEPVLAAAAREGIAP